MIRYGDGTYATGAYGDTAQQIGVHGFTIVIQGTVNVTVSPSTTSAATVL